MVAWGLLFLVTVVVALLAMAFFTLFERKFLGLAQVRKGPSKVGIVGLLQPFADAMKLFLKQQLAPSVVNRVGFMVAPVGTLALAMSLWAVYPHVCGSYFITFGAFFFLIVSSLNVYGLLAAGWCSNSKYALLGTVRGVAQTISYEIAMALFLLAGLFFIGSFSFTLPLYERGCWVGFLLPPLVVCWYIIMLAETNRAPFDLAEGESELVSGFNIEYGGGRFALIFMAEYLNILLISSLSSALFISGMSGSWGGCVLLGVVSMVSSGVFVLARAELPRMRYDLLMMLTWKRYLPFSLFLLVVLIPCMSSWSSFS